MPSMQVPPRCRASGPCKLLILPGGCNAAADFWPPVAGSDGDFGKYAAANGIVILKPCAGGAIDAARFPLNHENLRGMVDVYGQLGGEYATQTGHQMRPIGAMLRRLLGLDTERIVV